MESMPIALSWRLTWSRTWATESQPIFTIKTGGCSRCSKAVLSTLSASPYWSLVWSDRPASRAQVTILTRSSKGIVGSPSRVVPYTKRDKGNGASKLMEQGPHPGGESRFDDATGRFLIFWFLNLSQGLRDACPNVFRQSKTKNQKSKIL